VDFVELDPAMRQRVADRCLALPEAWDEPAWTGHRFLVRKKNFAHVFAIRDEEGAVRTMIAFRSTDEERHALIAVGHPFFELGWGRNAIGMVLGDDTDWDEVTELVTESYCVLAPKKLVALVARPGPEGPEPEDLGSGP
jgi:predicted DNA-binding protein (MmcQ/YjbR family)